MPFAKIFCSWLILLELLLPAAWLILINLAALREYLYLYIVNPITCHNLSAMGTLQQIHTWSLTHHPRWLVVVRVALGLCLFIKGISFMINATQVETVLAQSRLAGSSDWISIVITWAHLLGGFLIIIGLFTRWAVLLQVPILLGAIIFLASYQGIFAAGSQFPLSVVIFLLLIFFLVEGGGPLSLDNWFKQNPSYKARKE